MVEKNRTTPDRTTQEAEEKEATAAHRADRMPTPEEEKAAPTAPSPGVAAEAEEMARRGADVDGEGQLP
jgi:hypothetical protein